MKTYLIVAPTQTVAKKLIKELNLPELNKAYRPSYDIEAIQRIKDYVQRAGDRRVNNLVVYCEDDGADIAEALTETFDVVFGWKKCSPHENTGGDKAPIKFFFTKGPSLLYRSEHQMLMRLIFSAPAAWRGFWEYKTPETQNHPGQDQEPGFENVRKLIDFEEYTGTNKPLFRRVAMPYFTHGAIYRDSGDIPVTEQSVLAIALESAQSEQDKEPLNALIDALPIRILESLSKHGIDDFFTLCSAGRPVFTVLDGRWVQLDDKPVLEILEGMEGQCWPGIEKLNEAILKGFLIQLGKKTGLNQVLRSLVGSLVAYNGLTGRAYNLARGLMTALVTRTNVFYPGNTAEKDKLIVQLSTLALDPRPGGHMGSYPGLYPGNTQQGAPGYPLHGGGGWGIGHGRQMSGFGRPTDVAHNDRKITFGVVGDYLHVNLAESSGVVNFGGEGSPSVACMRSATYWLNHCASSTLEACFVHIGEYDAFRCTVDHVRP